MSSNDMPCPSLLGWFQRRLTGELGLLAPLSSNEASPPLWCQWRPQGNSSKAPWPRSQGRSSGSWVWERGFNSNEQPFPLGVSEGQVRTLTTPFGRMRQCTLHFSLSFWKKLPKIEDLNKIQIPLHTVQISIKKKSLILQTRKVSNWIK